MISSEELRRVEAKCNLLISVQEDYKHVLRAIEARYGVKLHDRLMRRIIHGATGPLQVHLEQTGEGSFVQPESSEPG